MSAAHTPGPWGVERTVSTAPPCVVAGEKIIAFLGHEEPADAALIEASPDLLAALKEARQLIEIWHGPTAWDIYAQHSPEMKRIDGAIAKAERRCARCGLLPGCPDCAAVHDVGAPA